MHPTIEQEIERKAITELQRIMHALTTKRLGIVAASSSLQTLWETVSGLVSAETMDLIGQSATTVQTALRTRERPEDVAVFVGDNCVGVVRRLQDRVIAYMGAAIRDSKAMTKVLVPPIEEPNPSQWCIDKFKSSCEVFAANMRRAF